MGHITIRDLARMCNVSVSTASNAYNRPDQLSAGLRTRILAKADEVGYAGPAPAARSLRRGKCGSVGVLFPDALTYAFSDPYAIELLRGISQTAEETGHSILLLPGKDAQGDVTVDPMRQASVDGVVSMCSTGHPAVALARLRNIPIVGTFAEFCESRWAAIDDLTAGRQLGRHLADLGHRRVAVIDNPGVGRAGTRDSSNDRCRGLRETIPGVDLVIHPVPANRIDLGVEAARDLLNDPTGYTAIVGCTDLLALGVLQAVTDAGLRPGWDITVAGFDDIDQAAGAGLTTVAQPIYEKGRTAGRLLLDPDCSDHHLTLPTQLVVRTSSGPARPRRAGRLVDVPA